MKSVHIPPPTTSAHQNSTKAQSSISVLTFLVSLILVTHSFLSPSTLKKPLYNFTPVHIQHLQLCYTFLAALTTHFFTFSSFLFRFPFSLFYHSQLISSFSSQFRLSAHDSYLTLAFSYWLHSVVPSNPNSLLVPVILDTFIRCFHCLSCPQYH